MNHQKADSFLYNPEIKHLVWCSLIWIVGFTLSLLAMTDLFRESFFQSKNTMMILSMIGATSTLVFLFKNYLFES